jgi:hypothetical protein
MIKIDWGPVIELSTFMEGCTFHYCDHHGGIIVSPETLENSPYFDKLKSIDMSQFLLEDGNYAFEQDCNACVILILLPREILAKHYEHCKTDAGYANFQENCNIVLKGFNPKIYAAIAV